MTRLYMKPQDIESFEPKTLCRNGEAADIPNLYATVSYREWDTSGTVAWVQ